MFLFLFQFHTFPSELIENLISRPIRLAFAINLIALIQSRVNRTVNPGHIYTYCLSIVLFSYVPNPPINFTTSVSLL